MLTGLIEIAKFYQLEVGKLQNSQKIEPVQIYSAEEIASFLKVSVYTVVRRLKEGDLRGKKVGASWRVLGEDLLDYIRGGNGENKNN